MKNIGLQMAWVKVLEEAKLTKFKHSIEAAADVVFAAHETNQISDQQGLFCLNSLIANH